MQEKKIVVKVNIFSDLKSMQNTILSNRNYLKFNIVCFEVKKLEIILY